MERKMEGVIQAGWTRELPRRNGEKARRGEREEW
jgi:hypothetical protein